MAEPAPTEVASEPTVVEPDTLPVVTTPISQPGLVSLTTVAISIAKATPSTPSVETTGTGRASLTIKDFFKPVARQGSQKRVAQEMNENFPDDEDREVIISYFLYFL